MSTPAPPPRLSIYFALDAGVAVIVRRGPTKWSQLIAWDLKKNKFEPGQWLHGTVDSASLSPNGRYLALGIRGNKLGKSLRDELEYTLICRPPYFTALAINFRGLGITSICFTAKGDLVWTNLDNVEYRTHRKPAFRVFEKWPVDAQHISWPEGNDKEWKLPNGRRFIVREGCIYEMVNDREKLLFDAGKETFREVEAPEWARNW